MVIEQEVQKFPIAFHSKYQGHFQGFVLLNYTLISKDFVYITSPKRYGSPFGTCVVPCNYIYVILYNEKTVFFFDTALFENNKYSVLITTAIVQSNKYKYIGRSDKGNC